MDPFYLCTSVFNVVCLAEIPPTHSLTISSEEKILRLSIQPAGFLALISESNLMDRSPENGPVFQIVGPVRSDIGLVRGKRVHIAIT